MKTDDMELAAQLRLDQEMDDLFTFLRQRGLKETERTLLSELQDVKQGKVAEKDPRSDSVERMREASNSECRDLSQYVQEYEGLQNALRTTVSERCKPELNCLLFPAFACLYVEFVMFGSGRIAEEFAKKYGPQHEPYWQEYVRQFACITTPAQLSLSPLSLLLKPRRMLVRLSRESERELCRVLVDLPVLGALIKSKLFIELTENPARTADAVENVRGYLLGEAPRMLNKTKVFSGIFKDLTSSSVVQSGSGSERILTEEKNPDKASKKKKAKGKDASGLKKLKTDPNAPPWNRVPLPDMSEAWKADHIAAQAEVSKRCKSLYENRPTIYFYTICNPDASACCFDVSENSNFLSVGYSDSSVYFHSLTPDPLKCLKSASELESMTVDSDELETEMWDESSAKSFIRFCGHSGPVYGVSYSANKQLLLSCSEDATIRLWNIPLRTPLLSYRYGVAPVLDVQFGPFGGYFATGGADSAAFVWVVERHSPVRVLNKHIACVNCVRFHPNSNYVATGSDDRTVRLWDVLNGQCVRLFTGHKAGVQSLGFSPDGRMLASGASNGDVVIWDIAQGQMMHSFKDHTATVCSIDFSRDSWSLASGGLDEQVVVRSLVSSSSVVDSAFLLDPNRGSRREQSSCSFRTKNIPVQQVHFTRRNLLYSFGVKTR
uniref:WD_REPEATS_REGION domain-containing protein n=1 Tax=Trichuris muris TaxID=70415 RepID=A0A5S6QP07_TRIMR